MIRFGISIGVTGRISGHKVDVVIEKALLVVTAGVGLQGSHDNPRAMGVEGILSRLHLPVIMLVSDTPVFPSALKNHFADDLSLSPMRSLLSPATFGRGVE
jgi:hypothetical protein